MYDDNYSEQKHVHEVQGSVEIADKDDPHSHRFATISGEAIPYGNDSHYHEVKCRTDFFKEHYHEFRTNTSVAIKIGEKHVHYLQTVTTEEDKHKHELIAVTFIEDPTYIG